MKLLSLFFPNRCPFCGTVIHRKQVFCEDCPGRLSRVPDRRCRICGVEKSLCVCRKRSYPCTRRIAPFYYEGVAKQGVLRFKKQGRFGGYRTLASLMAEHIRTEYADVVFDAVVSVPAHRKSQRKRGFVPTVLLAKETARQLGLPYDSMLVKILDNPPQKGMSRAERVGNVAGVFDLRKENAAEGKRLLLIDDVITTGATVNECAKILRIFGASYVYAASVCVNRPPKKQEKKKS